MRIKYLSIATERMRNISSVMTRLRRAHERSLHEFKFNDQYYDSGSTSHQQS